MGQSGFCHEEDGIESGDKEIVSERYSSIISLYSLLVYNLNEGRSGSHFMPVSRKHLSHSR